MYEYGWGITEDLEKATFWYNKAAEQGDNDAIEALKRLANIANQDVY